MGVEISLQFNEDGDGCYVVGNAPPGGLKGGRVVKFDFPTVTRTENVMLAAALVPGITYLHNVAREPEIVNFAQVLQKIGARVEGAGTASIIVHGKSSLRPFGHHFMADRIECGTFIVAGALMGNPLTVRGGCIEHQEALVVTLRAIGATITVVEGDCIVIQRALLPRSVDIQTSPYQGIPADMQTQFTVRLAMAASVSTVDETTFENRFLHVPKLNRMGADIRIDGRQIVIHGVRELVGSALKAADLRGSAAMVLAALVAAGTSTVHQLHLLDRGYERMEVKLALVGANISRFEEQAITLEKSKMG